MGKSKQVLLIAYKSKEEKTGKDSALNLVAKKLLIGRINGGTMHITIRLKNYKLSQTKVKNI